LRNTSQTVAIFTVLNRYSTHYCMCECLSLLRAAAPEGQASPHNNSKWERTHGHEET
jgi:hypothetical protein